MSEPCNCDYYGNTNCRVHNENHPSIVIPALKAKLQAAQSPDFEALLAENERLCELINAIEAKLLAAEARANEAESALAEALPIYNKMTERVIEAEARAEKAEGVVKAAMAWSARWKRIQFRPRQHNLAAPVLIQQEDVDLQAAVETLVEGGNTL